MKKSNKDNHSNVQGIARAKRIRFLREEVLKLSREKFAQAFNISRGALQNWEDARYSGLTDNGAIQLTKAFQAAGITGCSEEWLLYGRGKTPHLMSELDRLVKSTIPDDETSIAQELQTFYRLHQNAMDAIVQDDGLEPCLVPGDYVAGVKFFAGEIHKAIGFICIVQLQNGEIMIRKLSIGEKEAFYTLSCTNPSAKVSKPIVNDAKIFSAAPIIWVRKPAVK